VQKEQVAQPLPKGAYGRDGLWGTKWADMAHDASQFSVDERELQSRRAFFELTDDDLRRLAALRPFAERHLDDITRPSTSCCWGTWRPGASSPTRPPSAG
jgi:hypothetical protein